MSQRVEAACNRYLDELHLEAGRLPETSATQNIRLIRSSRQLAVDLAEKAERFASFSDLIEATTELLGTRGDLVGSAIGVRLGNFFRLNGTYINLAAGQPVDSMTICSELIEQLQRQVDHLQHLLLVELVDFGREHLELPTFEIVKLSNQEWDTLVGNQTRQVFFSAAVLDTGRLSKYWWIRVKETAPRRKLGVLPPIPSPKIRPKFSGYPGPVEEALELLSTVDWDKSSERWAADPTWGPTLPRFPILITVSDSRLLRPAPAPSFDDLIYETLGSGVDGDIVEVPAVVMRPNPGEFEKFVTRMVALSEQTSHLRGRARFLSVANRFLLKGMLTDDLDQMLANVTVVDALLSSSEQGFTTKARERLCRLLAQSEAQSAEIGDAFKEIYRFRSNLVHGEVALEKSEMQKAHLSRARRLARDSFQAVLELVATLAADPELQPFKWSKEDLFRAIDVSPSERALQRTLLTKDLPVGPRPPRKRLAAESDENHS